MSWSDTLVCAVAAYLPPVARYCNDTAAIAWRHTLESARAFMQKIVDVYRVMTEVQQHPALPPPPV